MRPSECREPQPHLAQARTDAFAEETVYTDERVAQRLQPGKRVDGHLGEVGGSERAGTSEFVEAHPGSAVASHDLCWPEQPVVLT